MSLSLNVAGLYPAKNGNISAGISNSFKNLTGEILLFSFADHTNIGCDFGISITFNLHIVKQIQITYSPCNYQF